MKTWEPIIHNRAELKALGWGVLRGLIIVGVAYGAIRIAFTLTGTAELVPCSVSTIVMIVYAFNLIGALGMINLRDHQLRIIKQSERTD